MEKPKYETHESYGVAQVGTVYGRSRLFGSSIDHQSCITLSIHHADIKRDLHRDWILPSKEIIEIKMSYTQFAEMIMGFGKGEGTPCTIKAIQGERMLEPPFINKTEQFDKEFQLELEKLASEQSEYYTTIQAIMAKPTIGKKDREEILIQLRRIREQFVRNLPFVKKSYNEQIEKTMLEAKGEIEAFTESKLRSIGIEGFKKELMELSTGEEDKLLTEGDK